MSYSLTVFVNDQSTITLDLMAEKYRETFGLNPFVNIHIRREGVKELAEDEPAIIVAFPLEENDNGVLIPTEELANKWLIIIRFMRGPMHPDDKKRILTKVRNPLKRSQIAECKRWIWISTSYDIEFHYINEYIHTTQILDEFRGLYVFDDNTRKFLNQISEYAQKS